MVRTIVLVVIVVLALSFFGISIRAIVESPTGHENIVYISQLLLSIWHSIVGAWHDALAWLEELFRPISFPQ